MAIIFDQGSNSGIKASVTGYNFPHPGGTLLDGVAGAIVISRGGASLNTDLNVSSATYNGLSMSKAIERNNGDVAAAVLCVSIWYLVNPPPASQTIQINFQGTASFSVAYGFTLAGVDVRNPIDSTASSAVNGQASPDSTSITILSENAFVLDGIYNKIGTSLTKGVSQNLISTETFPAGGGDTADASYKGPLALGSNSMSWTFSGADDYCQALVAFRALLPNKIFNYPNSIKVGDGMSVGGGAS